MNSSFDNIIKSEKPVLIDFLLLGADLASAWAYFKRGERQSRRWNFHYIKSMSIKPRSIQVSGARCSHNDSFQAGKQLWRESGVLDKNAIIKVILDKVINDKKALCTEQAY
jgi:thioredoxin 1